MDTNNEQGESRIAMYVCTTRVTICKITDWGSPLRYHNPAQFNGYFFVRIITTIIFLDGVYDRTNNCNCSFNDGMYSVQRCLDCLLCVFFYFLRFYLLNRYPFISNNCSRSNTIKLVLEYIEEKKEVFR